MAYAPPWSLRKTFILFAENLLMGDMSFFACENNKDLHALILAEIKTIINKGSDTEDIFVSTQQQIYIKASVLLYMIYIRYIISCKLSAIGEPTKHIKIGYRIEIDKMLLNRLFGTKEGLEDVIYTSDLIRKNDTLKKLRINAHRENPLSLIQHSLTLQFSIKSLFIVARLYEDYVQLTLNQVVADQKSIIIRDEIISIPNVYDSLCLKMWNNIIIDKSLIKLCDVHKVCKDYNLLDIFSLENQTKFTSHCKKWISKNDTNQSATDKHNLQLSLSCNCTIFLTANYIMDISFQSVLRDITYLVSASFKNKEFFGNYWNIQYLFQSIHFKYNTQFEYSLIKMSKETTEDVMLELEIDIPHYVIPKPINQYLQPTHNQPSIFYKEFQVGVLHHVYSENYGFGFNLPIEYKTKRSDKKNTFTHEQTVFPLLKRGDKISGYQLNRIFYLYPEDTDRKTTLSINFFKLKTLDDLELDGTVRSKNISETLYGSHLYTFPKGIKERQCIPIIISTVYNGHSSSLSFVTKVAGEERKVGNLTELAEPMTLRYL